MLHTLVVDFLQQKKLTTGLELAMMGLSLTVSKSGPPHRSISFLIIGRFLQKTITKVFKNN